MADKNLLIREIAMAITKTELRDDEVTAKMLADSIDRLTHRTALNRLNYYADLGLLVMRKNVGQMKENAYSPAKDKNWEDIIPLLGE